MLAAGHFGKNTCHMRARVKPAIDPYSASMADVPVEAGAFPFPRLPLKFRGACAFRDTFQRQALLIALGESAGHFTHTGNPWSLLWELPAPPLRGATPRSRLAFAADYSYPTLPSDTEGRNIFARHA